jgi:hypothetical protein
MRRIRTNLNLINILHPHIRTQFKFNKYFTPTYTHQFKFNKYFYPHIRTQFKFNKYFTPTYTHPLCHHEPYNATPHPYYTWVVSLSRFFRYILYFTNVHK